MCMSLLPDFVYKLFWHLFQQGGGLDVLSERFPPQQATPPLMMEERPALYPQPYSSPSPTASLPGPFQGMVRQKPSLGTMPVQVTPPRGTFSPSMGMQPRQSLNRPPAAPNQLRLQLQQRLQGQQQVSAVLSVFLLQGFVPELSVMSQWLQWKCLGHSQTLVKEGWEGKLWLECKIKF